MESLVQDLCELTLKGEEKSKTGFVYNEEANLHFPGINDGSQEIGSVFENPDRIKEPLEKLKMTNQYQKSQILCEFDEVEEELLIETHGDQYL